MRHIAKLVYVSALDIIQLLVGPEALAGDKLATAASEASGASAA
jgi:hypothetical protein